ncbi:MAG: penicillin-binding protein 2 [Patescibacteria group bacterium]
MVFRLAFIALFIIAGYTRVLFQLYDLQLVEGNQFLVRAGSEYLALRFLRANRGAIYFTDKDGNLLPAVLNKEFPLVYAVPSAIDDAEETANLLAPILERPVAELIAAFSNKEDKYEPLVRKAEPELADEISALRIKGIYVEGEPGRFYPLDSHAAHALGFVSPKSDDIGDIGQYGLESFYEELLRGYHGEIIDGEIVRPTAGKDLVLTIDPNIEIEAEKILGNLVHDWKASGGSIIVMDPNTGKILAMASAPNFDPNNYSKFPVGNFLNPVTQEIYEPGSVFKVITMAIGIDTGKITPDTTYYDSGSVTLNGWTIKNYDLDKHGPYGRVTMTNVIEHSINTGAVFAEREIGRDLFTEYLHNFGFSAKTGIDLPSELPGDLGRLNPKERDVVFATASYGQGVAVTPIGLINAMAAIANGGVLVKPYLNAAIEPEIVQRIVSVGTAQKTSQMMVSAVDNAGVAKIKGYAIAGKTGTAFVPDFQYGGYTEKVINTYVGFGPACTEVAAGKPVCDPKFITLIKLDEPEGAPVAALTVVPAFRDLAQFILNYYDVPPDRL